MFTHATSLHAAPSIDRWCRSSRTSQNVVVKHPRSGCNGLDRSHRDALSADRADGVASVHIRPPSWRGTAGPLRASIEADDSPIRRDATDAVAIRRMFHVKHSRRCFGSLVLPGDIGCAVRAADLLRSSQAEDSHQVCASRGAVPNGSIRSLESWAVRNGSESSRGQDAARAPQVTWNAGQDRRDIGAANPVGACFT